MIIKIEQPFAGQHCETTATGTLLHQIGISLSESMLFGIGEGLGFIYWKMKTMDFPFIGGRVKTDLLTKNICDNLNLNLEVMETSSVKKAWSNAVNQLEKGKAVGLKLDCYHLEYFTSRFHFAGHYAALYGYDSEFAYLIDTDQQGGRVKTSLESLALARNEKGPMSSKNLSFTIQKSEQPIDLKTAISQAIRNNARRYLNPPIKNLSYKGILKASSQLEHWFNTTEDVKRDFQTSAMLMERAGTGGSLFRNLYRDFLFESAGLLKSKTLEACYLDFEAIALQWKSVSRLFHEAGETSKIGPITQASKTLHLIAEKEQMTMNKLLHLND